MSFGALIGQSIGNLKCVKNVANTIIKTDAGVSPIDLGPVKFQRVIGYQTIQMRNLVTGFMFCFDVEGGNNGVYGGYVTDASSAANYNLIPKTNRGCTIITDEQNLILVQSDPADGGRRYQFEFSIFVTGQPTIQKLAGFALTDDIEIHVTFYRPVPL
jgi:hypothetical protein